jgi:hypothetical protein
MAYFAQQAQSSGQQYATRARDGPEGQLGLDNTNAISGGFKRSIQRPQHDPNAISYGGFKAATATAPETTVPKDRGMRKYESKYSATEQFRPIRKKLEAHRDADMPQGSEGKRYMPPPTVPERPRAERAHSNLFNKITEQETRVETKMQMKTFVLDNNGISVGRRPAHEASCEDFFQTKTRVKDYSVLRNGIEAATPGDKNYSAVEYSNKFFRSGGLVPGANIGTYGKKSLQRKHMTLARPGAKSKMLATGKNIMANESVLSYEKLSYEAKRQARQLREEMEGVEGLTESTEPPTGSTPSWEDRTGLHTWTLEEELPYNDMPTAPPPAEDESSDDEDEAA